MTRSLYDLIDEFEATYLSSPGSSVSLDSKAKQDLDFLLVKLSYGLLDSPLEHVYCKDVSERITYFSLDSFTSDRPECWVISFTNKQRGKQFLQDYASFCEFSSNGYSPDFASRSALSVCFSGGFASIAGVCTSNPLLWVSGLAFVFGSLLVDSVVQDSVDKPRFHTEVQRRRAEQLGCYDGFLTTGKKAVKLAFIY